MVKVFLLVLAVSLLTLSCGKKSEIKNDVKAERLADAYGNGKYVISSLTFPLSDSSLNYQSDFGVAAPIIGGILKFVGNIFTKNTKLGKVQMAYTQPLPEIPEALHAVRLSRVFFYMKPQGKQRRIRDWFSRIFLGKGHVTFDFLDKFAVRASTKKLKDPDNYVSSLETKDYDRNEMATLMKSFTARGPSVIDPEKATELVLFKYDGNNKSADTRNNQFGEIHILETKNPEEVKHFFRDQAKMKSIYKRMLILDNSLLIELKKDPIANETFRELMGEVAEKVEDLGVTFIDTCTPQSCLELNPADVNLIPIALKGNALLLDAVIHAGKVPESFNLKGFVEFTTEINVSF